MTTKIDSTGRFIITVAIHDIQFFELNYQKDTLGHTCRIIVEPGKNYILYPKVIIGLIGKLITLQLYILLYLK